MANDSPAPRVSVIMAAYNAARFVGRALESILTQTLTDLELIVVDDGSTDGTGAIIDGYAARDPRVRVEHQPNAGRPTALNRAIALARGGYIAPYGCRRHRPTRPPGEASRPAGSAAGVGMVGGSIKAIDASDRKMGTFTYPVEPSAVRAQAATGSPILVAGPTPMLRREFLLSLGGFRTTLDLAQDYDLALRALEETEVANVDSVVVYYRMYQDQGTGRNYRRQIALGEVARISARLRKAGQPDPVGPDTRIDATTVDQFGLEPAETERLRKMFLPAPAR